MLVCASHGRPLVETSGGDVDASLPDRIRRRMRIFLYQVLKSC